MIKKIQSLRVYDSESLLEQILKARSPIQAMFLSLAFSIGIAGMGAAQETDLSDYKRPMTIPFDTGQKYSPQLATLGKMLFFDPRLSGAENMSCASCHNPSFGYEAPTALAVGAANKKLDRHAPTLLNAAWVQPLFWDGRAKNLEEQAAGPITATEEMNGDFTVIVSRLKQVPDYVTFFNEVFLGQGLNRKNILNALGTYERTIVSGWSSFDRWVEGDEQAISQSAQRGFGVFIKKANYSACHAGWNFTDNKFHDIGLKTADIGRAKQDPDNTKARHAFETPGLRNTAYRAPFMHTLTAEKQEASLPTLPS